MQKVKNKLTMAEMQYFLKLANGDRIPIGDLSSSIIDRLRKKISDDVVESVDGKYHLGEIPEDLIINLRHGLIGKRER